MLPEDKIPQHLFVNHIVNIIMAKIITKTLDSLYLSPIQTMWEINIQII